MKRARLTEDAIPNVCVKQRGVNPKRISSLMKKMNRKRVCMNDNSVILGANYWKSPVHTFVNKQNLTYSQNIQIHLGLLKAS